MKKVLAFILTIICLVMLVACDTNIDQSQNNAQPAYLSGKVIEIYESGCLLEVIDEGNYGKLAVGTTVQITTNIENCPEYVIGDYLTVEFDGTVAESYPPKIFHVLGIDKIDSSENIILIDRNAHTDYAGVYLTLSSLEGEGDYKMLNAVWHNETNQEIVYGNEYQIEILEDNEWESVLTGELIVTSIAHILEANDSREKTYSTELFDLSKEGTYRLRCNFSLSVGDGTLYSTWIEFEIKDKFNIKSYSVTVEDDEFLYEKLNDKYKEGEQVVVKTEILLDASITVYVNGESIGMGQAIETGDEYTHWEYYFTMPSEDVVIRLEITDGFLP